jgi:FKBP-type peptidyl-prolyl cis-trans isomerase FkpA
MSKIKFYFILFIATIGIVSCSKDKNDDEVVTPPRDYATQYAEESVAIEDYLKTNYISEIVNHPGFPDDQDVTIKKITDAATQPSLWSYLGNQGLPRLTFRNVIMHTVDYKIYTLVIREGVKGGDKASGGEYPCNLDGVFSGYKGTLLDGTVFDSSNNGQVQYNLDGTIHDGGIAVIRGWSEGFPQFKTGWISSNPDGTLKYNDFGVGVMFLPSDFGYYNVAKTDIPAYSPLVFSIKLYAVKRFDHDSDGVPTFQEDISGDRYMNVLAVGEKNPDDTDGDGTPDFLDFDDDGDGYATRGEVKDANGKYYEFDKIPDCSGDQVNPLRTKRHLDKNCIKMNQ